MRTSGVVVICLVGGLLSGCEKDARTAADQRMDKELVRTLNNVGVENAIITGHLVDDAGLKTDWVDAIGLVTLDTTPPAKPEGYEFSS